MNRLSVWGKEEKIAGKGFFHPFHKQRAFSQASGGHFPDALSCLSLRTLIHARKHANKFLIQCSSANQEFTDASVHRNEQKGVLIAGFSYSPQSSSLFLFLPIPYPLNFDACYAVNRIACIASFGAKEDLAYDRRRISDLRLFPSVNKIIQI